MIITLLKKMFRPFYYFLKEGEIVELAVYENLDGYKWIINKNYGMAYYKGYYEPKICTFLNANLKERSCFVDVGAHAGYFSLFAASIAKKGAVYSFEPEPNNYRFITEIKSLNKISNWEIFNKAVGSEDGKAFFNIGNTSSTGNVASTGEIEVDMTSIDLELKKLERLDILKIDVEGFGGKVLEGAMATINRLKPKLLMEIHEGSDELKTVLSHLDNDYDFTDLDTGNRVSLEGSKVNFIIGLPKI